MEEEDLLKLVIEKQTWEEIIYHIVSFEKIDPWDVNIIKLTNSFLEYIKDLKVLDFRIPAKVVLVAAILLKLKSEVLSTMKEREEYLPEEEAIDEFEMIRGQISEIEFRPVVQRHVKRKVTLDELVGALRKAMRVEEKKEETKRVLGRRLRKEIDIEEIDIEERISKLMLSIDSLLMKLKSDKVEFSKILEKWDRDEIVKNFMPLLHLSTRGDVKTEQKKFFDEIFVSKTS